MASPFPGMDPYLEDAGRWHPFHTLLVTSLAREIERQLPERYYVSVEERTYLSVADGPEMIRRPDVSVVDSRPIEPRVSAGATHRGGGVALLLPAPDVRRERYLQVRDLASDESVVTVLEVLSPTNKRPGPGRDEYLEKRGALLASGTHLVEIDLLRAGPRLPALGVPEGTDYSILISRASERPEGQLLPFGLRDSFPEAPLPLASGDSELLVNLADAFAEAYETGRYRRRLPYREAPEVPLSADDAEWAEERLRDAGLRQVR